MSTMFNFLKPTFWKFVFALFLFIVSSLFWRMLVTTWIMDIFPLGFPFRFFVAWGPCPPGQNCSEINGLFLVFDLLFWYLVSAFAVEKLNKR